jgi:hypothetical protein
LLQKKAPKNFECERRNFIQQRKNFPEDKNWNSEQPRKKFPEDIKNWTSEEVSEWMVHLNLGRSYQEDVSVNEIDGNALIFFLSEPEMLREFMPVIGDRMKLISGVKSLSKFPVYWSETQVCDWVASLGLSRNYTEDFCKNSIDGLSLASFTENLGVLVELVPPLGDRLKLISELKNLHWSLPVLNSNLAPKPEEEDSLF